MVDEMTFPGYVQAPTPMNLAFLADITMRLLLNRAHYSMYSENPWVRPPASSLHTICHELYRQLRVWHDSLPGIIKPDLSSSEDSNQQSYVLRLRYWSAKDILFRPFVVYAISLPSVQALSQGILDKCELCLSSCRNFIFASERLLSQYTSYAYSALHTYVYLRHHQRFQLTLLCQLFRSSAATFTRRNVAGSSKTCSGHFRAANLCYCQVAAMGKARYKH
jgi:hypothetical protein